MPYINITTNKEITQAKMTAIKAKLGEAITLIPGKVEAGLIVGFVNSGLMFHAGEQCDAAFVTVDIFSFTTNEAWDALIAAITKILGDELGIESRHIYIKVSGNKIWGSNGQLKIDQ